MGREITQISSDHGGLVALCNDGTLWEFINREWALLPRIPQIDPGESQKKEATQ